MDGEDLFWNEIFREWYRCKNVIGVMLIGDEFVVGKYGVEKKLLVL